jgi:hypothetical protein
MKEIEQIKNPALDVVLLYLQNLEILNNEERKVLIQTIHLMNNPMFISTTNTA